MWLFATTAKTTSPSARSGWRSKYPVSDATPDIDPDLARTDHRREPPRTAANPRTPPPSPRTSALVSSPTSRARPARVPVRPPTASASRNAANGRRRKFSRSSAASSSSASISPPSRFASAVSSSAAAASAARPPRAARTTAASARGGARLRRDRPDPSARRTRRGASLDLGQYGRTNVEVQRVSQRAASRSAAAWAQKRRSCSATRLSLSSSARRARRETGGDR